MTVDGRKLPVDRNERDHVFSVASPMSTVHYGISREWARCQSARKRRHGETRTTVDPILEVNKYLKGLLTARPVSSLGRQVSKIKSCCQACESHQSI